MSPAEAGPTVLAAAGPDLVELAAAIHEALLKRIDGEKLHGAPEAEARILVQEAATTLIAASGNSLYGDMRDQVVAMVTDEVLGLGPLQPLLNDPSISEIMVNGAHQVFCERDGVIRLTDRRFRDEAHVRRIADRILAQIGRRVDEASPLVDARLTDGSRVNVTIPPATPGCVTMTIRKFRGDRQGMDDLLHAGAFDRRMQYFLNICVENKKNMLVAGGTGSGKTTLLNALSASIPSSERIVTIEDPVELSLQQSHVIAMEARPPDLRGMHAITQGDLLRNALRMRPDRIIVGEIRGAEAFDMLQAMNTGHDGSLSTVHANSPSDALARVANMVLMAGLDLPVSAIREQLASAVHLIVQLQRFPDGARRVVKIAEITGLEGQSVSLQEIFTFQAEGRGDDNRIRGSFHATGLRPTFSEALLARGCELPPALFLDGVDA